MKKFLSLVLALVMAMSLVTISAGATEYKDLSDKDEIQYEEAVAVLNRIGIITGYEDGSFRPETELTRGAAAKIIVSLMIGPEAASALPNNASPYPDVPAGHTFAGVIGYCKTAGYISGYGDGTFKPANPLTGYAFAKMLLGALGYKSDLEGFTGTGWTMNVARLGNAAGLFNRLSFQGADAVNREEACQLALNTLKATMVEYTGGFNITAGEASVVGAQTRTYVTSNQAYAQNILNRKADSEGNAKDDHYTVEFGEEHFKDLRLNDEHRTARDSFGRPSNEWSYKKVTIGTFPIEADFVFDKQMAHVDKTDAVKNRATGLGGYDLETDNGSAYTAFWVNGVKYELDKARGDEGEWQAAPALPQTYSDDIADGVKAKVSNICDLTDNGTVVEVYVSEDDADFITDVVVVQTQLMEVRRIGSDYVSLLREDDDDADSISNNAYNMKPLNVPSVDDVKAEDSAYSVLSELEEGDVVAVIPVAQDSTPASTIKYDVSAAYVPETVKGALTAVETYGTLTSLDKDPVSVTVGGTAYPIALWSRDLRDIDGEAVKMTRKDVTLYLDKNGNALKAEDVGSTDGWMVIGRYYEDVVDRHLVTMVEGWDTSGEKLELNLGNFRNHWANGAYTKGYAPGDLVRYVSTTKGNAEWDILTEQGKNKVAGVDIEAVEAYSNDRIEKSDVRIPLVSQPGTKNEAHQKVYVDSTGIKFVYVTYESDGSGEVEAVEIKKGVQEATAEELKDFYDRTDEGDAAGYPTSNASYYTHAQVGYTSEAADNWVGNQVKVVVIKSESNDATATNLMYIRDQKGGATKLSDGTMVYHYTVVMLGPDGYFNDKIEIVSDDYVAENTFVSYSEKEIENYSGSEKCYDLREHNNFTGRPASTFQAELFQMVNKDKGFVRLAEIAHVKGSGSGTTPAPEIMSDTRDDGLAEFGGDKGVIRIYNAKFADLRSEAAKRATREISSYKDLKWLVSEADNKLDANEDNYVAFYNDPALNEKTLELQLIVNDKTGNGNFREAALVVITDEVAAEATVPAKTGKDVTLTIEGIDDSWTNGGTVRLTTAELAAVAKINLEASEGATITTATASGGTFAVTANADNTELTVTGAPADTNTLAVTVTSEANVAATYTFTFEEDDGTFTYSEMPADAITVVAGLEDQDLDEIGDLIFLDDGTAETMEKQALEALRHLGVDVNEDSVELLPNGDIAYSYTTPKGTVLGTSFTPDIDAIKVTVGETPKYVDVSGGAANVKALDGLTVGNVRETKADGTTVVDLKGKLADLTATAAAGSTYEDAAFVVYTAPAALTDFSVVAKIGQKTLQANDVIELTDTVTITVTCTTAKAQAAAKVNGAELGFGVVANKNGTAGTPTFTMADSENVVAAAGKVTFDKDSTTGAVAVDDEFICTYTVVKPTTDNTTANFEFQANLTWADAHD